MFIFKTLKRKYSQDARYLTSEQIRAQFIDYFTKNRHKFVKSSPVWSATDQTVPFVNSGMVQFKSILQGDQQPRYNRVTNYQKCIRVGGKHNDLSVVGTDGYHHTFFEMLGNWSFNNYFKADACQMAWQLLTDVYKIPRSALYVTYFNGDTKYNLPPDLETRDIWRSLDVADSHILPFGSKENFWEMAVHGPCGPCTEIHVDHTFSNDNRSACVNMNYADLTEVWNLVFIQNYRDFDGKVIQLDKYHVDTGMGLERLVALLQGKSSNYDTDLFTDIFDEIHQHNRQIPVYKSVFNNDDPIGIFTHYRIVADHCRMITACLTDGMLPDDNYKLRKIIRKTMQISQRYFSDDANFLFRVCQRFAESMKNVYPEMLDNVGGVKDVLLCERETMEEFRREYHDKWSEIVDKNPGLNLLDLPETPGLIGAIEELEKHKSLDGMRAYKIYDTFGLDVHAIQALATYFQIEFNPHDLKTELNRVQQKTRANKANISHKTGTFDATTFGNIAKTNDTFKYNWDSRQGKYRFEPIDAKILAIVKDGNVLTDVKVGNKYDDAIGLILDRTNLYCERGGQQSDMGRIDLNGSRWQVAALQNIDGRILHTCIPETRGNLLVSVGDIARVHVDHAYRVCLMQNHTATHLLNAVIAKSMGKKVYQKSSRVASDYLRFDFQIFDAIGETEIAEIERMANELIGLALDVRTRVIDGGQLSADRSIQTIPGELYPQEGVRVVEFGSGDLVSKEACCGTHLNNTAHIKHLVITNFQKLARSKYSISAVCDEQAARSKTNAKNIEDMVNILLRQEINFTRENIMKLTSSIKSMLKYLNEENKLLPYLVRVSNIEKLHSLEDELKTSMTQNVREILVKEMLQVIENKPHNEQFVIHKFKINGVENARVQLDKCTRLCANLPVLVVAHVNNEVKARCCVPAEFVTEEFTAEKWLWESTGRFLYSRVAPPRGQDAALCCVMRPKKLDKTIKVDVDYCVDQAKTYAEIHCKGIEKDSTNSVEKTGEN